MELSKMKTENVKSLIEVLNSDARNAMHSILGFLELLSEGVLDPAQSGYIEACRAAADRHFRGIEDVHVILGLAAEEKPVIAHFAPSDLFARVAEVIGAIARRKGVALFCNVDSSVPHLVSADLGRIGHTLLRISEAVVSAIEGGDVHLNLRALLTTDGIDLIFEIFVPGKMLPAVLMFALEQDEYELDASLPGSEILALAAARCLATAVGGRVDASGNSSTGTRVAVTIPVAAPAGDVVQTQPRADLSSNTQRALRILVAEDSEDSFQLFRAFLQGQPHSIARATNGAEAVELASRGTFDLLFMDIRMPVMDGYAATRRIRELETGKDRPRMPIIVLSAEDLRTQRRQGALVGCSGHLAKPIRKHELLQAIRAYSHAGILDAGLVNSRSEPLKISM
jgi:CheY-like chemotaxis protein